MRQFKKILNQFPVVVALAVAGLLIIAWYVAAGAHLINTSIWSSPAEVARTLWTDLFAAGQAHGDQVSSTPLYLHLLRTMWFWLCGFTIAAVLGLMGGFLIASSKTIEALSRPVVNVLRSLPSAAIWPLCGMAFSFQRSQIIVIVFGALWPVVFNTAHGLLSLPVDIYDSLRFMRMTPLQKQWALFRWALPTIFTGIELSAAVAFLLTVTVQIIYPAEGGVGSYLAWGDPSAAQRLGGVLLTAAMGWLVTSLVYELRRKIIFWEGNEQESEVGKRRSIEKIARTIRNPFTSSLLQTDQVTELIEKEYGKSVAAKVLYQGRPYIFPKEVERMLRVSLRSPQVIQREITIDIELSADSQVILFARSWIDMTKLSPQMCQQLDKGVLTIGTIVRQSESQASYKNLWYRRLTSEKLSNAFGRKGTVPLIQRARLIRLDGKPAILIQEYLIA